MLVAAGAEPFPQAGAENFFAVVAAPLVRDAEVFAGIEVALPVGRTGTAGGAPFVGQRPLQPGEPFRSFEDLFALERLGGRARDPPGGGQREQPTDLWIR